ncbi:hypothetical protein ACPA9J_35140 [Pseudomonas aeruginosa]
MLPAELAAQDTQFHINPTGNFGDRRPGRRPRPDRRKIIVDS